MPKEDGTGPQGQGPKTGRGLGNCSGYERPGLRAPETDPEPGQGMGTGWRPGRGMANRRGLGLGRGRGPGRSA